MTAVWLRLRVERAGELAVVAGGGAARRDPQRRRDRGVRRREPHAVRARAVRPRDPRLRHGAHERQHARQHQPAVRFPTRSRGCPTSRRRPKSRTTTVSARHLSGTSFDDTDVALLAPIEGGFGTTLNSSRVLHGRLPTRPRRDRALVARRRHARRARRRHVAGRASRDRGRRRQGGAAAAPRQRRHRDPGWLPAGHRRPPAARPDVAGVLSARTPTRTRCSSSGCATARTVFPRSRASSNRLSPNAPVVTSNRIEMTAPVQRGLDVQATALRLLGAVVALLTVLLLGQALARLATLEADDDDVLRGLGFVERATAAAARSVAASRSALPRPSSRPPPPRSSRS